MLSDYEDVLRSFIPLCGMIFALATPLLLLRITTDLSGDFLRRRMSSADPVRQRMLREKLVGLMRVDDGVFGVRLSAVGTAILVGTLAVTTPPKGWVAASQIMIWYVILLASILVAFTVWFWLASIQARLSKPPRYSEEGLGSREAGITEILFGILKKGINLRGGLTLAFSIAAASVVRLLSISW